MNNIKIDELALKVQEAATKFPGSEVLSIGIGSRHDCWVYCIFLDVDGKEIRYEIPMQNETEV